MDGLIARSRAAEGDVALFAPGQALRVFIARWIGLPPRDGEHFLRAPCVCSAKNTGCADPERASLQIDRRELLMSPKAKIGKLKRYLAGGWKVISSGLASF
jgi:hypothetical protein